MPVVREILTVRAHGETGWTARLIPLTVDGVIYGSWMIALDSAPQDAVPVLARWLLGLGVVATLAATVWGRPDRPV
jgi:hypothetical protein